MISDEIERHVLVHKRELAAGSARLDLDGDPRRNARAVGANEAEHEAAGGRDLDVLAEVLDTAMLARLDETERTGDARVDRDVCGRSRRRREQPFRRRPRLDPRVEHALGRGVVTRIDADRGGRPRCATRSRTAGETGRGFHRLAFGAARHTLNARTGRTSTLPTRAGGIFDANLIASFKSLASIR